MFWMNTEQACYENRNPPCHHLTMASNDFVIGLPHWVQREDRSYPFKDFSEQLQAHSFHTHRKEGG